MNGSSQHFSLNTTSSLSVAEQLHDLLAHVDGLLVPPLGEEGDLGVHELPLGVGGQVPHHVVQDVLHLVLVVTIVRLDPPCGGKFELGIFALIDGTFERCLGLFMVSKSE